MLKQRDPRLPDALLNNRRLGQFQKTLSGFALKQVTKIFADDLIFHHQVVHPVL